MFFMELKNDGLIGLIQEAKMSFGLFEGMTYKSGFFVFIPDFFRYYLILMWYISSTKPVYEGVFNIPGKLFH